MYQWEEFGTIQTKVDLSGYVTQEEFIALKNRVSNIELTGIFANDVLTSTGQQVAIRYTIPDDLYNFAVNDNQTDEIIEYSSN